VGQDKVPDRVRLADEFFQARGSARSAYDVPASNKKMRCHGAQDGVEEEKDLEEDLSWVREFALRAEADLPADNQDLLVAAEKVNCE
jgi:hypothetical protein